MTEETIRDLSESLRQWDPASNGYHHGTIRFLRISNRTDMLVTVSKGSLHEVLEKTERCTGQRRRHWPNNGHGGEGIVATGMSRSPIGKRP